MTALQLLLALALPAASVARQCVFVLLAVPAASVAWLWRMRW